MQNIAEIAFAVIFYVEAGYGLLDTEQLNSQRKGSSKYTRNKSSKLFEDIESNSVRKSTEYIIFTAAKNAFSDQLNRHIYLNIWVLVFNWQYIGDIKLEKCKNLTPSNCWFVTVFSKPLSCHLKGLERIRRRSVLSPKSEPVNFAPTENKLSWAEEQEGKHNLVDSR